MKVKQLILATAGAMAVLALAGCSFGDAASKVPPTATGSLESLAAKAKCKPAIQTDTDTIRQAICTNSDGKFVLVTFSTDRGQREWINEAKDYGGYYLVGRKWVADGSKDLVTNLRGTLGGDIEIGTDHHAHGG
ncbi:hypothetical protein AB0N17_45805 [Streptomyces sp. NPDC051133]|uniref:hypothetical protein n=1 Tax=Streptomyces sp. NPDC051133 TaxID=3155521 RepID=UPI00341ACA4D